jgi:hypothetical protein
MVSVRVRRLLILVRTHATSSLLRQKACLIMETWPAGGRAGTFDACGRPIVINVQVWAVIGWARGWPLFNYDSLCSLQWILPVIYSCVITAVLLLPNVTCKSKIEQALRG